MLTPFVYMVCKRGAHFIFILGVLSISSDRQEHFCILLKTFATVICVCILIYWWNILKLIYI